MTCFNPFFSLFVGGGQCTLAPHVKVPRIPSQGLSSRFKAWFYDFIVLTVALGFFFVFCPTWFFIVAVLL